MASGFKLANPREYRRGVIMGLTLAEVLILLVFLLLLSCAALLTRREEEVGALQAHLAAVETSMAPLVERLRENGLQAADLDQLVAKLNRADREDKIARDLEGATTALTAARSTAERATRESDELRAKLERAVEETRARAANVTQADRLLSMLGSAAGSGDTAAEKLRVLLERADRQAGIDRDLLGQNAQMRTELARLKGNGGSGLPYCWTTPDGKPVYMLRIELRDESLVVVNDIEPRPRPDDRVWPLLNPVPRGERFPVASLIAATAGLQAEANAAKCRYAVLAVDGTGQTNKPGYKSLMNRLWSVFMVHEVAR